MKEGVSTQLLIKDQQLESWTLRRYIILPVISLMMFTQTIDHR